MLSRALFALFLAVVILSPVLVGRSAPWSKAFVAAVVWGLVVAAASLQFLRPQALRPLATAALPLACLSAFSLVLVLQLAPQVLHVSGMPLAQTWAELQTISGFATRQYLLSALSHIAVFLLTLMLVQGKRRLLALAAAIVAGGLIQAVTGVALLSYGEPYTFLGREHLSDRALGTFVNPDHLANYLALCLSAGFGLLLAQIAPQAPARTQRERWVRLIKFCMSSKMLLRLMLVVMVIGLVLTRSRMGNFAFFSSLLLAGAVLAWRSPRLRRGAIWLVVSLIVVDVVVVGQWVGLERVVQRLEQTAITEAGRDASQREETVEQRMAGARYALQMIEARPWLGFGGGTFYAAFPPFKGAEASLLPYDHAHNDYVELAADTGLLGFGFLAAFVLATGVRAWKLVQDRQARHHLGVAIGALMAISVMLMHSVVDFSLQIPANGLTFTVLLAMVWSMQSQPASASRAARGSSDPT